MSRLSLGHSWSSIIDKPVPELCRSPVPSLVSLDRSLVLSMMERLDSHGSGRVFYQGNESKPVQIMQVVSSVEVKTETLRCQKQIKTKTLKM